MLPSDFLQNRTKIRTAAFPGVSTADADRANAEPAGIAYAEPSGQRFIVTEPRTDFPVALRFGPMGSMNWTAAFIFVPIISENRPP